MKLLLMALACLHVSHLKVRAFLYFDQCVNWTFHRWSEMDSLLSAGDVITELTEVQARAECFSHCAQRSFCNLVLHNTVGNICRLYFQSFYSHTAGVPEPDWQYFGVPCSQYRLEHLHPEADILTSDATSMCDANHYMTTQCPTPAASCLDEDEWKDISFQCVPDTTHFGTVLPTMSPTTRHIEDLTFDLAPGMKLKLEVSGDDYEYNEVDMELPNGDLVYHLSLRWEWDGYPSYTVFNTKVAGEFGTEDVLNSLTVNNRNNYVIEIHILDREFETYTDGSLMMTNQMRLPFIGVSRVALYGFTSVRHVQIGFSLC